MAGAGTVGCGRGRDRGRYSNFYVDYNFAIKNDLLLFFDEFWARVPLRASASAFASASAPPPRCLRIGASASGKGVARRGDEGVLDLNGQR